MTSPRHSLVTATFITFGVALFAADAAHAMCGCMVSRRQPQPRMESSGALITNEASKVILERQGTRTLMTMSNDVDLTSPATSQFAIFIPVPVVLSKDDVKVVDGDPFALLERKTAPRVTVFHEPDPCPMRPRPRAAAKAMAGESASSSGRADRDEPAKEEEKLVVVEAEFTVGPFNIVILSSQQSAALAQWLRDGGYEVPPAAEQVIDSYLKQKLYFFVAEADFSRVDAAQRAKGRSFLPPLQVSFQSPRFGLPIRLGMVNAQGPQELLVFALAPEGRIEPTNYRNVMAKTEIEIPAFAGKRAAQTYRDAFLQQTKQENMSVVFTEWSGKHERGMHLTRLHFRYEAERFPEDLVLQVTADQKPFRIRYRGREPFTGPSRFMCPRFNFYQRASAAKLEREITAYAELTGMTIDDVRRLVSSHRR